MIPVILSGGSGHRLWPISRKESPKQFCQFLNESLFKVTLNRLTHLKKPVIVSNINLKVPTESSLNKTQLKTECIYEPLAKNTAPAIALAVKFLKNKGLENEWIGVFPSDHIIKNEEEFKKILNQVPAEDDQFIYLLGIQPREPKTGFGYIEVKDIKFNKSCDVAKFHEKPNLEKAKEYLESGNFLWNSGIFIFKPQTLINYFEKTNSTLWKSINSIKDFSNFSDVYEKLKGNSFDHEVLESFEKIKCIPTKLDWSDVGTWDEFSKVIDQSVSYKNETNEFNSNNNYYFSRNKKIITTIDVDDLIVVDSFDSLLICKKGSSEKVKDSLHNVKNQDVLSTHNYELRPWGTFEVLSDSPNCKVKKIIVHPGHRTSYQLHEKRDEHWTIVRGNAVVTIDGKVSQLMHGDSLYIPAESKHRIANTTDQPLEFIEVQTGAYFGEDDITRLEDDYGRVASPAKA